MKVSKSQSFVKELQSVINKHSIENGSNTPDFILAQYISAILGVFNKTVSARDKWYDINPCPGDLIRNSDIDYLQFKEDLDQLEGKSDNKRSKRVVKKEK